jgi:hypothetical protein
MDSTLRANLPYPGKVEPQQRDDNSRRQIAEANEAAWRDAFKPHAVILTERLIPQPLLIAAIVGGDRLKCVDFEPDSNPVTLIDQALDALREKLQRWNGHIPCFRKPTPFAPFTFGGKCGEIDVRGARYALPGGTPVAFRSWMGRGRFSQQIDNRDKLQEICLNP